MFCAGALRSESKQSGCLSRRRDRRRNAKCDHGVEPRLETSTNQGSPRAPARLADGCTQDSSNWTATDRCKSVKDNTRRPRPLKRKRIPSTPQRGPYSMLTLCPICRNGQGCLGNPDLTAVCKAAISVSSTGRGTRLTPTKSTTPGIERMGRRSSGSNLQKTYPGKSGSSISLVRSDHLRLLLDKGRKHS
jgi:hypothetical protein